MIKEVFFRILKDFSLGESLNAETPFKTAAFFILKKSFLYLLNTSVADSSNVSITTLITMSSTSITMVILLDNSNIFELSKVSKNLSSHSFSSVLVELSNKYFQFVRVISDTASSWDTKILESSAEGVFMVTHDAKSTSPSSFLVNTFNESFCTHKTFSV